MNRDQRKKLADVCFNEAVTCALRDDIEDAKELSKLYVKHEFREEIELIIGGNAELFTTIVKNQYSDSYKKRFISKVMLDCLIEDDRFKKTFVEKFIHLHLEEEGY